MIPEGWEMRTIDEIAVVTSGGTPIRAKNEYWNGNIPWVTTAEVHFNTITNTQEKITQAGLDNSSAKLFPPGTLLLAMYGQGKTRGQIAKLGIQASTNQACAAILLKKGFNVDFYYLFLQSQYEKIRELSNSGGQKNLSAGLVKNIFVPVPPFAEQTKISEIVSTWDKAIEAVEKLIENSRAQKKALMQQLLTGKKRLPGFSGEWQEVLLGDISDITTGSSNREDSHLDGKYTFFDRSEDIRTSDRYLFDCEAVIVPGEGQDFIPKHFIGKFDLHQRTYAIMNFKNCMGKYMYYAITQFRQHFLSHAVGSTVKSLRLPMFQKMKLMLPPLSEQEKITSVLNNADSETDSLHNNLNFLKEEKNALMQQLLTGKRRVKVNKDSVQEVAP